MKTTLKLNNQRIVEDLHDLKKFINSQKNLEKEEIYSWLSHSYKDDQLAEKVLNCNNKSEMLFCINKKLQSNLCQKLRLIEQPTQKKKIIRSSLTPKVIISQPRSSLIERMQEVHNLGR